jgi:hypothetical protein
MGRNRKNQSAAIRFGPALKAVMLCLLIGGSAIGYVWQKDQIRHLGVQITQRELLLKQRRHENEKKRKQLEEMRSLEALEARIRELKIGLALPLPAQVWPLTEPAREGPSEGSATQYAARGAGTATQ